MADLVAAYALHAVDDDEARLVEAHLATCEQCREDLADHFDIAASLVSIVEIDEAPMPDWMFDSILARATSHDDVPTDQPLVKEPAAIVSLDEARLRRQNRRRVGAISAIAAAVAAITIPLAINATGSGMSIAALAERAASQSGNRAVEFRGADGRALAKLVIGKDGAGYLVNEQLETLDAAKTYQLWAVTDTRPGAKPISVGLLGPAPKAVAFTVAAEAAAYAISVEPRAGSIFATTTPIASANLN
jgi:hypothetical protein